MAGDKGADSPANQSADLATCGSTASAPFNATKRAKLFLEKLGVNTLADLPPIGEFIPSADVVEALEQGLRIEPTTEPPTAPRG